VFACLNYVFVLLLADKCLCII